MGLDAMEIQALQETRKSHFLVLAEERLFALSERMRAAESHIKEQIAFWKKENMKLVPVIQSEITGDYPLYHIQISWPLGNKLSEEIEL